MKLKVGDKVFIKNGLILDEMYGRLSFTSYHNKGCFNVLEIDDEDGDIVYKLNDHNLKLYYSKEMIDWDKTKELQSKGNEMKEFRVGVIKKLLEDKLSGFNTENIRNQSTAKEIITIENTVMKKGITEVNKLHDLFHIKFNVDGVDCIVLRTTSGHLCGYIKTESEFEGDGYQSADEVFNAIGGITFVHSGYIGFDCAHYDQMSPLREYSTDGRYLPLTEVIEMTIDLASQEKKLRGGDKKEPSATFHDLIDTAVKASKDGLLEINKLDKDFITANIPGKRDSIFLTSYRDKPQNFKSDIADIKSLYTETFTIESEDDVNRINLEIAEAELENGKSIPLDIFKGKMDNYYIFCLLKGATITQRRK